MALPLELIFYGGVLVLTWFVINIRKHALHQVVKFRKLFLQQILNGGLPLKN